MRRPDPSALLLGVALHGAEHLRQVCDALSEEHFPAGEPRRMFRLMRQAALHLLGTGNGHGPVAPVIEALARDEGKPFLASTIAELYDTAKKLLEADPGMPALLIEAVRMRARRRSPRTATPADAPDVGEHPTDLGNARRLVARYGADLRYCHPWKRWLAWDDRRLAPDVTGRVVQLAKETALGIYDEAKAASDEKVKLALAQHAARSEGERRLAAMIVLAQSEPTIPVVPGQLDTDPWLLNVSNGTLDFRTGDLRPHRREDLLTKLAPVTYDPEARCPTWEAFLDRLFGATPEVAAFLQRFCGYALTGSIHEHVLVIAHGPGANGKTTFARTLRAMLGDYAAVTSAETFLLRRGDNIPSDLAALRGARLVVASEIESGRRLAESLVKAASGGDPLTARHLFSEWFTFQPEFKLLLMTNHRPVIRGTDLAMWRRIRLVPFTTVIPPDEQDRDLPEKLLGELPGVLAWAVRGCRTWQAEGLGLPDVVRGATEAYRAEQDTLAAFLEECVIREEGARVTAAILYHVYRGWCEQNRERADSKKAFGLLLSEHGFRSVREGHSGGRAWEGLRLRDGLDADA